MQSAVARESRRREGEGTSRSMEEEEEEEEDAEDGSGGIGQAGRGWLDGLYTRCHSGLAQVRSTRAASTISVHVQVCLFSTPITSVLLHSLPPSSIPRPLPPSSIPLPFLSPSLPRSGHGCSQGRGVSLTCHSAPVDLCPAEAARGGGGARGDPYPRGGREEEKEGQSERAQLLPPSPPHLANSLLPLFCIAFDQFATGRLCHHSFPSPPSTSSSLTCL